MDNIREKLVELLKERTGCTYGGSYGDVIIEEEIDISDEEIARIADHLIANGVTVQRERELVCVTKTGPSEAVYFRKSYFCPSCDTEIGDELLDVNTERVFGHGTVMKNNKFPKCCPECGTRIVMPTPPKGE